MMELLSFPTVSLLSSSSVMDGMRMALAETSSGTVVASTRYDVDDDVDMEDDADSGDTKLT